MDTRTVGRALVVLVLAIGIVQTGAVAAPSSDEEVSISISAEVVKVDGDVLVTKLIPSGEIRTVVVPEGREFIIDGNAVTVDKLKPGTVLSATITTVPSPDTVEVVSGTIIHISGMTIVMRMDNRQVKQFTASTDWEFDVGGKKMNVRELRANQRLTAVSYKADPRTLIAPDAQITGKSPR